MKKYWVNYCQTIQVEAENEDEAQDKADLVFEENYGAKPRDFQSEINRVEDK
ncbi:MAG: hypothetical protein LUQ65_15425 [Candidatus Helarchaeota archaeon]|nr:hypothetical protein [Candidatus Helarchaeota archaeon]